MLGNNKIVCLRLVTKCAIKPVLQNLFFDTQKTWRFYSESLKL